MAIEKKIDLTDAITSVKMPDVDEMEESIEVEVEDPEALEIAKAMGLDEEEEELIDEFDANLSEVMSEEDLQATANELYDGYTRDKDSRQEYDNIAEEGVTLLGLKDSPGNEPFPGACSATHPVDRKSVV